MPLRLRALPETIGEFELAADEKYLAGLELMTRGYGGIGIYLLGYTAEMLLKNAYFLLDATRTPTFPVGSQLGLARRDSRAYLPNILTDYHDLLGWTNLLKAKRNHDGRRLPTMIELPLMNHVQRLSRNWWVAMRYQRDYSLEIEVNEVYDDVTWIRDNYTALYTPRR